MIKKEFDKICNDKYVLAGVVTHEQRGASHHATLGRVQADLSCKSCGWEVLGGRERGMKGKFETMDSWAASLEPSLA